MATKERIKKLHPHPFRDKLSDIWDDIDIWFWRHFINPVVTLKDNLIYAWERATKGFDRRISWGAKSMIQFYVRMLSDLIEYTEGRPMGLHEIIPDDFKTISDKWNKILGTNFTSDFDFAGLTYKSKDDPSLKMTDEQSKEYFNDTHALWIEYLKRVRNLFLESDPDTCSQKNEFYDDFEFNPLWIEQENGSYLMEIDETPEQKEKNDRYMNRQREIEQYQYDCLKKALAEIARNPYSFSD